MLDDNKIRSIIYKMQADLLKWIKSYEPDLIRCRLQASDKNVESKDIKRGIANSLENEIGLSRRVIAYFSNPYQKNLADRLTAEIEKVNDIGSFDARQKNITIYYLPTILEIKSALDDCLAAIPCQPEKLPRTGVLVVPQQLSKEQWCWLVQIQAKENIRKLLNELASGIDGAKTFPAGLWDAHYIRASFIFKEAENAGIELPPVPTGSDTTKSFERLHIWINKSLRKISQPQKQTPEISNTNDAQGKPKKKLGLLPKNDFTFGDGQAFFRGKDLKLPAGETIEILHKLIRSLGKTVKHKKLDSQSTGSNASEFLRGRITVIRTALKKNRARYGIRSARGVGYILERT